MGGDKGINFSGQLIFRNAKLVKEIKETEIKQENTLKRLVKEANPRIIERVPKNNQFKFKIIYFPLKDEHNKITKQNIRNLIVCMRFLEDHYLGGNGSRGYGKIKFSTLKLDTMFKSLKELQIALKTNGTTDKLNTEEGQ